MKEISIEDIRPIDHDEAMQRAEVEIERLLAVVDHLSDTDWERPTDCADWTVRHVLCHLLGMWELQADPEERTRQIKAAGQAAERSGRLRIDELTALQVVEHAQLSVTELRQTLHEAAPRALSARRDLPPDVRAMPYDPQLPGEGSWTIGYLFDIIHTRDPWLHRVDICRATDQQLVLSPEHDGRIVQNVVAEWAYKHNQPFALGLSGPAGDRYVAGPGGTHLTLDAVEFCRILSGRAAGPGLLNTAVTF